MQRAHARRITSLLLAGALALGLAGCGSDDADTGDDTAAGDMDMADDDHEDDGDDHESFAFGEPADAGDADRTVEVEMHDDLSYSPATIEVEAGETVTFEVTNAGAAVHEFTLGDASTQDEHEAEMQEMMAEGTTMEHTDPNTLSLEGGASGELTWHFTEAGEVLFGCHQPGHYAGGMVGTIDVG